MIAIWVLKINTVSGTFPDSKNMESPYLHKYNSIARTKHALSMLRPIANECEDNAAHIQALTQDSLHMRRPTHANGILFVTQGLAQNRHAVLKYKTRLM